VPNRRISHLINLGPVSERQLAEVGIRTEDQLRAIGAVDAWRMLKFRFAGRIGVIDLYALEGAIRGCPWKTLPAEVKTALHTVASTYDRGQT
jgi:DNA transformation protein